MESYTKCIGKTEVLKNINLTLQSPKIYGLQGKNASGKTMLLRAISGLIFPTEGRVIVDQKEIGKEVDFPENMGILIETPEFIHGYSAFENLKALALIDKKATDADIRETLCKLGLDPDSKKKFRQFSLGMKEKLGIAAALMEKPKLILLDEPTNALDEESVKKLSTLLQTYKRQGALIVIASHDKEEMQMLCDEIIQVENGKIKQ